MVPPAGSSRRAVLAAAVAAAAVAPVAPVASARKKKPPVLAFVAGVVTGLADNFDADLVIWQVMAQLAHPESDIVQIFSLDVQHPVEHTTT